MTQSLKGGESFFLNVFIHHAIVFDCFLLLLCLFAQVTLCYEKCLKSFENCMKIGKNDFLLCKLRKTVKGEKLQSGLY